MPEPMSNVPVVRLKSFEAERDDINAGEHAGEPIYARAITGRQTRTVGRRDIGQLHGHAGERRARAVRDRAADRVSRQDIRGLRHEHRRTQQQRAGPRQDQPRHSDD